MRNDGRQPHEMRPVTFQKAFTKYAPGSVLVSFGDTKVLCTATLEDKVPPFMRDQGKGWITAEYSLLPGSTHTRVQRELNKGKPSGRTSEIQRLIGRSLRSIVNLDILGERSIYLDADVIQADGGTRTAAITGCMVAMNDAIQVLLKDGQLIANPITEWCASVSVGIVNGVPMVDLCYEEDSKADVDMNLVMTESGKFVEIQGTAEQAPFDKAQLQAMTEYGEAAIRSLFASMKCD
jgi:ribonuclease PH